MTGLTGVNVLQLVMGVFSLETEPGNRTLNMVETNVLEHTMKQGLVILKTAQVRHHNDIMINNIMRIRVMSLCFL